jgi:hypothetical protein
MANYKLMIMYMTAIDKDIKILQDNKGTKPIVKQLIKLQEFTRDAWAKIHTIIKTMDKLPPEEQQEKSQDVVIMCMDMNVTINSFYDKIIKICIEKQKKGDSQFLNYVIEEVFYSYSIFLDALHYMGIYYVAAESFPFILANLYAKRKITELGEFVEEDEDEDEKE